MFSIDGEDNDPFNPSMRGADVTLMGEDVTLMGQAVQAVARQNPAAARYMAQAIAQRRANAGTLVSPAQPMLAFAAYVGFDSVTTIAAGATLNNIVGTPQVSFKGRRLVVPSSIAASFLLNSVTFGQIPVITGSTGITGAMFTENATYTQLNCPTIGAGTQIIISATNISGGALRFTAGCEGESVISK